MLERNKTYTHGLSALMLVLAGGSSATAGAARKAALAPKPAATSAPAAAARPYAMRDVELGITLDEFRRIPVPVETGQVDPTVHCSDESTEEVSWFNLPEADTKLGVLSCAWFAKSTGISAGLRPAQMTIQLGSGLTSPTFQFVTQGAQRRLFRIISSTHISDAEGFPDALTRNFGTPRETVKPFQTRAGATYPATTLVWRNARSSITLTRPCLQLDRYCLAYEHTDLKKIYDALIGRRDAAAANKI